MPDEDATIFNLEGILTKGIMLEDLEEGTILHAHKGMFEDAENSIQYDIKHLRNAMKEIYKLYEKNPTKKELMEVLEKHKKKCEDDTHDFFSKQEMLKKDQFLKVIKKKDSKGKLIVEFKKIEGKDKEKIIKSILDKLMDKLTKEQMRTIIERGVIKYNDYDTLKKIDNELNKGNPKIEGKRGCYKLVINDVDLMMVD